MLLEVNPTLAAGGYPEVWTQYTATLSGIPGGATGRIAWRYFVTDGGPSGANSNYIGIDTVEFTSAGPAATCDAPSDVPWLSEVPTNGTTAGGASTPVQVTFNSTGLAAGTYNANLCIDSNDPDPGPGNGTERVIVPVQLVVEEQGTASIELNKTVGTVPGVCATTNKVTVPAGTEVYYCYQVENTGDVTLNFHDLDDSELGEILDDLPYTLAPGAFSPQVIVPETINITTTNVATWTAVSNLGGFEVDDADRVQLGRHLANRYSGHARRRRSQRRDPDRVRLRLLRDELHQPLHQLQRLPDRALRPVQRLLLGPSDPDRRRPRRRDRGLVGGPQPQLGRLSLLRYAWIEPQPGVHRPVQRD